MLYLSPSPSCTRIACRSCDEVVLLPSTAQVLACNSSTGWDQKALVLCKSYALTTAGCLILKPIFHWCCRFQWIPSSLQRKPGIIPKWKVVQGEINHSPPTDKIHFLLLFEGNSASEMVSPCVLLFWHKALNAFFKAEVLPHPVSILSAGFNGGRMNLMHRDFHKDNCNHALNCCCWSALIADYSIHVLTHFGWVPAPPPVIATAKQYQDLAFLRGMQNKALDSCWKSLCSIQPADSSPRLNIIHTFTFR